MYYNNKQRYYAQIVDTANAKKALADNFRNKECQKEVLNNSHDELGKKMYLAFENILDNLATIKPNKAEEVSSELLEEIGSIRRNLDSFVVRVDKTLIELYKRMEQQNELIKSLSSTNIKDTSYISERKDKKSYSLEISTPDVTGIKRKKTPKSETRALIMNTAGKLSGSGKKLMLTDIAKEANIPYHQAVYACKGFKDFEKLVNNS